MGEVIERASDPWLEPFRELFKPGLRVLDVACGTGDDTLELLEYGVAVTAFDKSEQRVNVACERAPDAEIFVHDMLEQLPLASESYDIVIASLCLHYFDLATTRRIVGDISLLLKPGGILLARVNRVGDLNFEYGKGREIEPDFFEVAPGRRKRFFSAESLRAVLETALEVEMIVPATTTRWGDKKLTLVAKARRSV